MKNGIIIISISIRVISLKSPFYMNIFNIYSEQNLHFSCSLRRRLYTSHRFLMLSYCSTADCPSMTDGPTQIQDGILKLASCVMKKDRRDTRYIFRISVLLGPPPMKSPPIQISYQSVIHKVR